MPSFYFEQLLQTGLNGIDQQGITAAVLQIAGVILILSLLWSVYEAYSNGGDVRLLGVAAVKYLVLGLVFLNYQSAFRAVNSMFNGVADGIYNLSGGLDAVQVLVKQPLPSVADSNPNWFSSLWNLVTGGISAIVAGLITLVGYLILPFTYTLFTLFYALYGSILYVVGPFVLALIPSRGLGQLGRTYFVNMMIFQCWGLLVRNPAIADVGAADHQSNAVQRLVSASVCRLQPDDRDERGQRLAVDHGRPHPFYRKPHRPWRHRQHLDDCDQWSNDCGSCGVGIGIRRRRRPGRRAAGAIRRAAISPVRWFRCSQSRQRSGRPRSGGGGQVQSSVAAP